MVKSNCPNCQHRLNIPTNNVQQQFVCPKCRQHFTPVLQATSTDAAVALDKDQKRFLIVVYLVAFDSILIAAASILKSPGYGVFVAILAITVQVAVWNHKCLFQQLQALADSRRDRIEPEHQLNMQMDTIGVTEVVGSSQSGFPQRSSCGPKRDKSGLQVVQHRKKSRKRSEGIPEAPPPSSRQKQVKDFGVLPPSPRFFESNELLDLGFGSVVAPFVYASSEPSHGQFDVSLIDGSLPVSQGTNLCTAPLPYWPSYYDMTPDQRKNYLDWLIGGRSDPEVELGYVFIYFYGLERRVVVDQRNLDEVADELMRLIPIYGASRSFRGYASRLMWLAIFLQSTKGRLEEGRISRAVELTSRWTDDLVQYLLGTLFQIEKPVQAAIASVIAKNDHRSSSSVIVKRHGDRFRNLFEDKFNESYPAGLKLKASKNPTRISYSPASGSLLRDRQFGGRLPMLPDVMKMTAQFKPLVAIWDGCIAGLKTYNRLHRKSDGELTAEVYESLPPQLREDDHPEYDSWLELWEKYADAEGWPLVPISELAVLKKIEERPKLTKTQSLSIVRTANAIGLGLVPDVNVSERNYGWREKVCLFFEDPSSTRNLKAYKPATILLRLGMSIAGADGECHESELALIKTHLEGWFNLSDADSKRLECLTQLLSKSPDSNFSITKRLCGKLSKSQRGLVGEFLLGIAAADGVLEKSELTAIKKAYRALELDPADVDELLARCGAKPSKSSAQVLGGASEELALDMNAIAEIMTETRQVSRLLEDAMDGSDTSEVDRVALKERAKETSLVSQRIDPPEPITSARFKGLPSRFHEFLECVLAKPTWEQKEIDQLARDNGQMLTGAVEAINEWSYEQFEDWIIEEGPEYKINSNMLVER